jgi:hypothetical protein
MRTLLTGQQGTPALCPDNRALFLFFYFYFFGGVHFFSKKNIKKLYFLFVFPLFLSLFLSCTAVHTLCVLLSSMNFTKVRCEGKLKKGVAYKL